MGKTLAKTYKHELKKEHKVSPRKQSRKQSQKKPRKRISFASGRDFGALAATTKLQPALLVLAALVLAVLLFVPLSGWMRPVAFAIPLLLASRKTKRLIRDFRLYGPVLAHEPDKSVPQLAKTLNKPLEEVQGQLSEMCRRGYFNGYLDHQRQQLVFAAQPQTPVHVRYCPGCGAKNAIKKTGDACRYCGAPLNV